MAPVLNRRTIASTGSTSSIGHGTQGGPQLEEPAQGREPGALVVDERAVVLERRVVAGPDRPLERVDGERVEQVVLAVGAVLVLAARRELGVDDRPPRRVGAVLAGLDLLGHDLDADAADAGRRPGEVLVHEVAVEPDRLEDLGAVVAVDRRDAHPRDGLDDALGRGLAVAVLGRLGGARDGAQADLVVDRLEGEVRVDRGRAVADEQAEVVGLARLAGLQEQADAAARPGPDEVVVDRRRRRAGPGSARPSRCGRGRTG